MITSIIKCVIELFIHSQTSTIQPLKFGMDKWLYPTLYWACGYLSIRGLKLIHVDKRVPRCRICACAMRATLHHRWKRVNSYLRILYQTAWALRGGLVSTGKKQCNWLELWTVPPGGNFVERWILPKQFHWLLVEESGRTFSTPRAGYKRLLELTKFRKSLFFNQQITRKSF